MSRYYDRQGNPMELLAWAATFEAQTRPMCQDEVGEARISTVWLGLDHNYTGDGPPLIFETMIFCESDLDDYTERYSTEEQARTGHERIVKALREGKQP